MFSRSLPTLACCVVYSVACNPFSSAVGGEVNTAPALDLEQTKRILAKEVEETLEDTGIPSISIALLKGDRIVWTQAFGYSNNKLQVPASPNTIYGTGSCLKPVTAMAVMQLVDRGKIKLDDPINCYLGEHAVRDLSAEGKPVSFRHLLSHHSGLTVKHETVPLWDRRLPKSLEQLASELIAEEAPGTNYRYSNSGYALAGLLVQKVSGVSYQQYLVDNILHPLGIKVDGPINPTGKMIEELAVPYRLENGKAIPETPQRFDVYPAGDAYLSVPAMAKILLTQINNGKHNGVTILSEESVREMQTRQFGRDGLDFGIKEVDGEKWVTHGGGVPGYSTKFILGVDSKVGVYVAANAGGVQLANQILAQRAVNLLRGKELGTGLLREIVGVGFVPVVDKEHDTVNVAQVFPRSPASRAGLLPGIAIKSVNNVSVKGKTINEFLEMIASPTVRLEFLDQSQRTTNIELSRGKFLAPS